MPGISLEALEYYPQDHFNWTWRFELAIFAWLIDQFSRGAAKAKKIISLVFTSLWDKKNLSAENMTLKVN